MTIRKNTRRFDPRYFMDEKTDLIKEGPVPHSAQHVVEKMKETGLSAKEALKSLTTDLSDKEAERWLKRHKDEMTEKTNEAWEPKSYNRGTRDKEDVYIDRGSSNKESESLAQRTRRKERERREREREEFQGIKPKSKYFEENEHEILIDGYGKLTVQQAERKLAKLLQLAGEEAAQNPPTFRYLDDGVIQAIHQALKGNKEL